jgi:cobalt/nickel transport system permease protein
VLVLTENLSLSNSIFHRMDPRAKLVGFTVVLGAMASVRTLPAALAAFGLAGCTILAARIPLAVPARRAAMVLFFLAPFFLILPWTHPGGPGSGAYQAAVICFKGLAMVLTIFPMFATAPFHVSMKALERLKLSPRFVTLILLTYRYLSLYTAQLDTVRIALRSRGFRPRCDRRTLRTLGNVIGSLLVRSFEQTERLYQSMRNRGYAGHFGTLYTFRPLSRRDWSKAGFLAVASLLLLVLDRWVAGGAG